MMQTTTVPKPSPNEILKAGSPTLSGTIAQTLADPQADHFVEDDAQFLKFHGVYPQDDPRRAGPGFGQQDAANGIPPVRAGLGRLRPDAEDLVGEGDDEHQDQEGDEEGDPLLVFAPSGHCFPGRCPDQVTFPSWPARRIGISRR